MNIRESFFALRSQPGRGIICTAALAIVLLLCAELPGAAQLIWQRLYDAPTSLVVVNPFDPNALLAGAGSGSVLRSYNGGDSWEQVEINTGLGIVSSMYQHPVDTNIVMVGGILVGSVFRSVEGGAFGTWNKVLDALPTLRLESEAMTGAPANPDVVYAANRQPPTVYRSSDKGATWDSVGAVQEVAGICTIVARPDSPGTLIAGCSGGTIAKSIDGGETWYHTAVDFESDQLQLEIPKIALSIANPRTAYAVTTYFNEQSAANGGLFKSTDGGETWRQIAFQDTSLWAVTVRQTPEREEVYIGGYSDIEDVPGQGIVMRSTDEGDTWSDLSQDIPWSPDADSRNVFSIKNANIDDEQQRLFLNTADGMFVLERASSVKPATPENGVHLQARIANQTLHITFTDPLPAVDAPLDIRLTDLQGRLIMQRRMAPPAQTYHIPLPPQAFQALGLSVRQNGRLLGNALLLVEP